MFRCARLDPYEVIFGQYDWRLLPRGFEVQSNMGCWGKGLALFRNSKGIVAIWDNMLFTISSSLEGDGFLAIEAVEGYYSIVSIHNTLTIVLGDFNEVRNVDERKGTMFDPRGASRFNNFILSLGLIDLPMGAKRFTRMNNLGIELSKIDRIIVSQQEFKLERGLCQGDPLSPFIFILALEALNVAILEATDNNIFKAINVGKDKIQVSHLQFVDDALIL
nr:cytochrome P450 [Tanacetum cinerariifolium]